MIDLLKFLQNPGFRTRLKVSLGIVLLISAGFLSENAIVLRMLYCFAVLMAIAEFTFAIFFQSLPAPANANLHFGALAVWFLLGMTSIIIFDNVSPKVIFLCLLTSYGADTLAYLIGSLTGGKLIKAKPFPTISPKKSWEGLLAGVLGIAPIAYFTNMMLPSNNPLEQKACQIFMIGGIISVIGDVAESWLKRKMRLHDSNDSLADIPHFSLVESWLGGKNGHGGYADRIDSLLAVIIICGGYCLITAIT